MRDTISEMDLSRPSLTTVGHDVLVLIIDLLADDHPRSMSSISLVNSEWHGIARRSRHKRILLDFSEEEAAAEERMEHIKQSHLLSAVRILELKLSEDKLIQALERSDKIPDSGDDVPGEDDTKAIEHESMQIRRFLSKLSGLRELYCETCILPFTIIDVLRKHCPKVQLQVMLFAKDRISTRVCNNGLSYLNASPNLRSLKVETRYTNAEECERVTKPLKHVLLSCPNLRSLTLDIALPSGGCVGYMPPTEVLRFWLCQRRKASRSSRVEPD